MIELDLLSAAVISTLATAFGLYQCRFARLPAKASSRRHRR